MLILPKQPSLGHMLQCVTVCGSVLQCVMIADTAIVAVVKGICCSVFNVFECIASRYSVVCVLIPTR